MSEDDVKDVIVFDWNIKVKNIKSIDVSVKSSKASVTVRLDSGNKIRLTVNEKKESKIIESIADILDIDEDDVEDLLDIDFND